MYPQPHLRYKYLIISPSNDEIDRVTGGYSSINLEEIICMQNIDFYDGRNARILNQPLNMQEAEYYTRMDALHRSEADKNRHRASRMMSFIIGLCIISFTAGLVIGIKFASGSKAEIVDPQTRQAVMNIRERVSGMMTGTNAAAAANETDSKSRSDVFPRDEFPFVIRLNGKYDESRSKEIASLLSKRGHTVILSRQHRDFKIYVGPFRTQAVAETSLKKIGEYSEKAMFSGMQIVKR